MNCHTSKVTLATVSDVGEIGIFIQKKYLPCKDWKVTKLFPWVAWYCESKFCVVSRNPYGDINALLLGRPCDDHLIASQDFYYYNFKGKVFYVDIVITNLLSLISALTFVMVKQIGMKDYLAFTRDRGNVNRIHIWKTKKILRYYAPSLLS